MSIFALFITGLLSVSQAQTACNDPVACNYTPSTTQCIRVEAVSTHTGMVGANDLTGMTTYRVFAVLQNTDDVLSAIIGDAQYPTFFNSSTSFFQHSAGSATPNGLNPAFYGAFPSLAFDSWITIGLEQSPVAGEGNVNILEDSTEPWVNTFESGNNLNISGPVGGGWYAFAGDSNSISGADNEVLVGQFTTSGTLSGQIYMQIFINGDSQNEVRTLVNLDNSCGLGGVQDCVYAPENYDCDGVCTLDTNANGVCDLDEMGCTITFACNYDATALIDDGTCEFISCISFGCTDLTACNYDPAADYDNGTCSFANFPYNCDGTCINDNDGDGICDEFEIFGCTDATACNYSSGATDDNGTCTYDCLGCTDPSACNFNSSSSQDDGSCEFTSCATVGCTDSAACNYNPDANYDDASCEYTSCLGCTDSNACNYDAAALIDDGSCDLLSCAGCTDATACNYDSTATIDDGSCDLTSCLGCTDPAACNYIATATIDDGSCDFCSCGGSSTGGLSFTTTHPQYGLEIETVATHSSGTLAGMTTYRLYLNMELANDAATSFTGNDIFPLSLNTTTSFYQEPIFGGVTPSNSSGAALSILPNLLYDSWITIGIDGPASAGESNVSLLPGTWGFDFESGNSFTVNDGIGSGWYILPPSASNGVADPDMRILFAQLTTDGLISGSFKVQIFPNGDSTNDNRADFTFSMGETSTGNACGCTSPIACNFDPNAAYDDGSCDFVSCLVFGCTDATACNYDNTADYDDGSCTYPSPPYDCIGDCINDADGDGICDELEIPGCTDSGACNFASGATDDDGSCDYVTCAGCTSPLACNFQPAATIDDGSCDFVSCLVFGCTDATACNYDNTADYDDGSCTYPTPPYDCIGECINDADGDGICDELEIPGCTDSGACNFASGATDDDGSCDFISCLGCTSSLACNYNPSASIDDGSCDFVSCLVFGCADSTACNYDPAADYDDGSCVYPSFPYDCNGICINDNDADGICDEFETFGCTDASACNYSSGATNEDGSCTYDCGGCIDPSACNFDPIATQDDGTCDFTSCMTLGCTDSLACNYNPDADYDDLSCTYIPAGDCDCNGNQLDALGVCGGDCTADADADGI
ncbi:MAG TPA: hypothetical protein EYN19_07885, partial [Flavobacteriales bacterium]|nr:hypothetical protein [Flavobacteriales bacterium]